LNCGSGNNEKTYPNSNRTFRDIPPSVGKKQESGCGTV